MVSKHHSIQPREHGLGKGEGKKEHHEGKKEHGEKKNWEAGAVKHPGVEKKAAAKAGESTHEYMEQHKHDSGKSGQRARLGLTFEKQAKEHSGGHKEPDGDETKPITLPGNKMMPGKKGVSKPKEASGKNTPSSENAKPQGPITKPGEPTLPQGVTETTGSTTLKGNPSYGPAGSSNAGKEGVHIHLHLADGKVHDKEVH